MILLFKAISIRNFIMSIKIQFRNGKNIGFPDQKSFLALQIDRLEFILCTEPKNILIAINIDEIHTCSL